MLASIRRVGEAYFGSSRAPRRPGEDQRGLRHGECEQDGIALRPISETLLATTPLILTGLAVAVAFRSGVFNIGAEGQLKIGAVFAVWVGIWLPMPFPLHLIVALAAGIVGGALWAFIPGILKAKTGAHEVITTIMLNAIAQQVMLALLLTPILQPVGGTVPISRPVLESAQLPILLEPPKIRVHFGLIVALLATVFTSWLMFRTTRGFEFRAAGLNPRAATYAGMHAGRTIVLAMVVSGGLSGLAGAGEVLGTNHYLSPTISPGYGWDAISLALLAGNPADRRRRCGTPVRCPARGRPRNGPGDRCSDRPPRVHLGARDHVRGRTARRPRDLPGEDHGQGAPHPAGRGDADMSGAPIGVAGPVLSAAERNARNNGYIRAASYAAVGALELFAGLLRVPADQVTVYKLVFDDAAVKLSDLTLPVGGMYVAAGLVSLLMAGLQLAASHRACLAPAPRGRRVRGDRRGPDGHPRGQAAEPRGPPPGHGLVLAADRLRRAVERSWRSAPGCINIGIEGIILLGACATSIGGSLLGNPIAGVAVGVTSGILLGLLLAVLCIRYQVDQIIAGTVLNLAATGITTFMYTRILQVKQDLNDPGLVGATPIPLLSDVPIIGPVLFNGSFFLYIGFFLIIVMQLAIYRTRWGLRIRAAGENPKAAGTIGIDVLQIRYRALAAGGAIAGFAGAYLVVVSSGSFQINMSQNIGFIGIAAMIFGGWKPVGVAAAALVFGFARSAESRLGTVGVDIPTVYLSILPYVVTIVVVAGLVGRVRGPSAAGQPYEQA